MDRPAASIATTAGRTFYWATMLPSLAIGGLQMARVHGGLVTDYGADLFGTAWLYAMTRLGWTVFQRGCAAPRPAAAAAVFVACAASEFGQRAGWVPGHFDPFDLIAFALAILACVALEQRFGPFVIPRARV